MNTTVHEMKKEYFVISKFALAVDPQITGYKLIQSSSNQKHMCFIVDNYPLPFLYTWNDEEQGTVKEDKQNKKEEADQGKPKLLDQLKPKIADQLKLKISFKGKTEKEEQEKTEEEKTDKTAEEAKTDKTAEEANPDKTAEEAKTDKTAEGAKPEKPKKPPLPAMTFRKLGPLEKCTEIPSCFEVAYDSSYLVTGYPSGNVFIFNPSKDNWVNQIIRSKRDDGTVAPLTRVTFAQDYQSVLGCDRIGNIFQILRFNGMNSKEVQLYEGRMPLTNVFMPATDSSYLLFSDNNSVNILNINTHEVADISSSPLGETIRFDAKLNQDKTVLLVSWNGTLFSMFRVESFTKIVTLFEFNFDVEIKECIIRKNFVVSIVFMDGSIDLVIGTTNPRIERYYTENLRKTVKVYSVWVKSHETLFFLTPKASYRVKFIEWAERLEKLARSSEFNLCFSMAEGIYTGTNLQVFGVEPDTAKRCISLQKKMKDIFNDPVLTGAGDDQSLIAQAFDCAVACDMSDYIIGDVYNWYKSDGRLSLFYNVIFTKMRRNITQCIPFEFYEEYLKLNSNDDDYMENVVIPNVMRRGIPRQYAPKLLDLAHNLDSEPLLLRLWTECFGDYVSPCIYLLGNGKVIPYMSDLFLTDKYKILPVHKKLVALYFCTPVQGSYTRLLSLFSRDNWETAPKFVEAFKQLLPIHLRNNEEFGDKEFCDAMVRVSMNKPVTSNPVLDVVAELIVSSNYDFPYDSISMMINWAFTTNKTKPSIRESVIINLHDQYEKVINYEQIVDYCEAAGFPRIVNNIYVLQQDNEQRYDHVIQTIARSEEWRPMIFSYIYNPYKDLLEEMRKQNQENEPHNEEENEMEEEEEEYFSEDEDLPKEPEKTAFQKFKDRVVETGEDAISTVKGNLTPEEIKSNLAKTFNKKQEEVDLLKPVVTVAPPSKAMLNEIGFDDEQLQKKELDEMNLSEASQDKVSEDFDLESDDDGKKKSDSDAQLEEKDSENEAVDPENKGDDAQKDSDNENENLPAQPKVQVIYADDNEDTDDKGDAHVIEEEEEVLSDNEKQPPASADKKKKNANIITFEPENSDLQKKDAKDNLETQEVSTTDNFAEISDEDDEESANEDKTPHPKFQVRKEFTDQYNKVGKKYQAEVSRRMSTSIAPNQTLRNQKDLVEAAKIYKVEQDDTMLKSIVTNIPLLVLINPDKAVELIFEKYPDFNQTFIKKEPSPFVKFLYLRAAAANPKYSSQLSESDQFDLFELMCKFSPPDVLPMLKSSQSIEIDKALPACTKHRVIDACIYIHTMLGDMQSAVNLVAEELEADLVDAIQSGKEINAPSIDLVKEEPELKKAYETVIITFDLLSKAPNQLSDRMWKDIFLAFQLPLWLVQQEKSEKLQTSICYFFAFFIVETLQQNRSSPENIFNTYELQFKEINQMLYRKSLSAVFKYLDYNQKLSETVIQLLMEDCINLYGKAQRTKTRASFVYHINCAKCNTPITGARGIGAIVYECGHCYHDDSKCGMHLPECQICKGTLANKSKDQPAPPTSSSRAQNQLLRKLQRVDYGLRRHYGKDQEASESGNAVFFFADYPVQAKQYLILNPIEKFPDQKDIFIEL